MSQQSQELNIETFWLDRKYIIDPEPAPQSRVGTNDDGGYKRDAGDNFNTATSIYPGEIVDDTPGRGNTGLIDSGDEDWYEFSVCQGQDINITLTPDSGFDFDLGL